MPLNCKSKAALYVNSDTNGRGFLDVEGSHELQHFASEAARDVTDPETGTSVLARAGAKERVARYEGAGGFTSLEHGS
jgi:N-acetylated-alpha-linked acidic dipeptidase